MEDHGPGIPPEEHEKIFERFYRRGSELRRETQGVGIGLTIVKHIVEAHGGRVLVRSAVGQGSRFTIELPMNAGAIIKWTRPRHQRILVIEDELPMRTALQDCLEAEGYRVLTAAEGETGLQRALAEHPDLVLLDIMMPRLDGYAVCAELRRLADPVPVLMLTAKGQIDDRVKGLDAGADDYLVKPFSTDELLARVRALLRRTRKARTRAGFPAAGRRAN